MNIFEIWKVVLNMMECIKEDKNRIMKGYKPKSNHIVGTVL